MSDNGKWEFYWLPKTDKVGERLFTFDGNQIFNLFRDYPHALTPEQKRLFDAENPFWANYFKDRKYDNNNDN